MNAEEAAARHVELAKSFDECTALTDPLRFGEVCAPNGPHGAQLFFLARTPAGAPNSSCEVVAMGILSLLFRELGRSELQEPLDTSGAVGEWGRAVALARAHGAYRSPEDPGAGLRAGCIVHVEGAGTGRHWYTLVEDLEGGSWRSVDGGQDDRGYQAIRCVTRTLRGGVYDVTSSKPVADWIDVPALLEALLGDLDLADAPVEG